MAHKFLPYFPKPLLDDIVAGRWLPVVGAGMSLNAILPKGKKMPLWGELGKALADDLKDFTPNGTLDAISAYEHECGRARLIERLSEILLIRTAQPGDAHKEFCSIPLDIVCTTNFDFLLERQYDLTPRYVYPVVDEEQLSINVEHTGTLLLKLHGDLRHPKRLVATEADYDGFLSRYPLLATYLSNLLITKTALFIGYSLDDPDFRQILTVVNERLGSTRRMQYALTVGASASDIKRFARRGVQVVNLPGSKDKYGDVLAQAFREIREYMRDNLMSVSKVTEEKPLRELSLPRGTTSRLCFFAVPLALLPFYREKVFPLVEEAGCIPVASDDVISPGGIISAKIDSLIDRASIMVVEVSTPWTVVEFRMALSRLKGRNSSYDSTQPFDLIPIIGEGADIPAAVQDIEILQRPDLIHGDTEQFVQNLTERIRIIASRVDQAKQAEPQRLFEIKEYRAAVISAMTLLETTLRSKMKKNLLVPDDRRLSLRKLIMRAEEAGIIRPHPDFHQIDKWIYLRNLAVHTPSHINKQDAKEVVDGVQNVLRD